MDNLLRIFFESGRPILLAVKMSITQRSCTVGRETLTAQTLIKGSRRSGIFDQAFTLNSFAARGGISRPFWVFRPKRPQKRSKIWCDLVERWLVRKLRSSAFQNAIARQISNFSSENTTLSNQAINLDALYSGLDRKKYRNTV